MSINHLDVKPGNILLDGKGRAVLIDFGLSKRYDDTGNQTSSTPVGISHGYAPLEQYKAGGVGTFSPTTDVYSLGATLYKLVTGQTPPDANTIYDDGFPQWNINISAPVKRAIEKAMQPRRKDRAQTVDEFLSMLTVSPCSTEYDESTAFDDTEVEATVIDTEAKPKSYSKSKTDTTVINESLKVRANMINGYEYVDLGLSVKWATNNVGASSPSDYGDYYAWGETDTKAEYWSGTSITYEKNLSDISGNLIYDVARKKWGSCWRLPRMSEFEELKSKCTWLWTTQGGHRGYKVTGPNGNSIFLPAAGWRNGDSLSNVEEYGNYWSSTPDINDSEYAYRLFFDRSGQPVSSYYRFSGRSVRPVSE